MDLTQTTRSEDQQTQLKQRALAGHRWYARAMGLQVERKDVTTEDGYVLGVYRIWSQAKRQPTKKPVLLLHGLFSDGIFYMIAGKNSLVYKLANEGFDVWVGNSRGTPYSMDHQNLDPSQNKKIYYDYSFYELGMYDLPAIINFMSKETGHKKFNYIGHSQGATQMFSALAENHGDLNEKISQFVALAPVIDLRGTKNHQVQESARLWKQLQRLSNWMSLYDIKLPFDKSKMKLCRIFPRNCDKFQQIFTRYSPYTNHKLQAVTNERKATSSMKQLIHFAQVAAYGFTQFDYNDEYLNRRHYNGSARPPQLNLDNISRDVRISLLYGDRDEILNEECVNNIRNMLAERVKADIKLKDFVHDGFSIGLNMDWTQQVLNLLNSSSE